MTCTTCTTCAALLNEALNLTVRGRTLDGIQRQASQRPHEGLFDMRSNRRPSARLTRAERITCPASPRGFLHSSPGSTKQASLELSDGAVAEILPRKGDRMMDSLMPEAQSPNIAKIRGTDAGPSRYSEQNRPRRHKAVD